MTTRWENAGIGNSTRNKENIPFSPQQQYNPSPSPSPVHAFDGARHGRPSLARTPGSQQRFITDSFLGDDSTQSSVSHIPSPSHPAPLGPASQRKRIPVRKGATDVSSRPRHRATRSEFPSTQEGTRKPRPKPATTRHMSLDQTNGLSTPPRSRQGSFSSPTDILSSPPPALTDNYARIDQEEDLAQTETDLSDPDNEQNHAQQQLELPANVFQNFPSSKRASTESLKRFVHSRGNTPTDRRRPLNAPDPTLSVKSDQTFDHTGMSFVNQLTDPRLKAALTPHYEEKVKRPVAFSKANQIRLPSEQQVNPILFDDHQVADAVSPTPRLLPERQIGPAFSKAHKIRLQSDRLQRPSHQRSFSDHINNTDHRLDAPQPVDLLTDLNLRNNDDDLPKVMPHNPHLKHPPFFAKNYGFPERGLTQDQATGEMTPAGAIPSFKKAKSASPLVPSVQPVLPVQTAELESNRTGQPSERPAAKNRWTSSKVNQLDTTASSAGTSDIWMNPDQPIKSIENNQTDMSIRSGPASEPQSSPAGKSRTLNYELTGFSAVQASDSPPIRVNSGGEDYFRKKEIAGLTKSRVATTQLHQLRVRESQEKLRSQARSPLSEVSESIDGDILFDLPLVQRTVSNGSRGSGIKSPLQRTRSTDDVLQRFARASSNTPRSNSVSDKMMNNKPSAEEKLEEKPVDKPAERDQETSSAPKNLAVKRPAKMVEATPKVTGAWTDTIMPETAKTMKRPTKAAPYAQTPYVNAGGWVDTPAPPTNKLESVTESTQEVEIPEELMQGIVKDSASDRTITEAGPSRPQVRPKGVVSEYLDRKQQGSANEDTLNPGETTIHSLKDLMDMDDTQLSQVSQFTITGQTDTQMLGALANRLGRLSGTIHEAHAGVDRLQTLVDQAEALPSSRPNIRIPALAHQTDSWLPHPTRLGWLLIALVTWYIVECTMAELYSHPVYANRYVWPSEPEPDFPIVLPTMLYRWCNLQHLSHFFTSLFTALGRILGMYFGTTDGFVEAPVTVITYMDHDEYV